VPYIPADFCGCELRVSNFPWGCVSRGTLYSPRLRSGCHPFWDLRIEFQDDVMPDLCAERLLDEDDAWIYP